MVYLDEKFIDAYHVRPYSLVTSKGTYDYSDEAKDIVYLTKDAISALTEWIEYRNKHDFFIYKDSLFNN